MHIGLLQCDSVDADLRAIHGDYPDMFTRMVTAGGLDATLTCYDLPAGSRPRGTGDCDAWLITGSRHGVEDESGWIADAHDLVRGIVAARRPVVGICFGHQLVASALDGRAGRSERGWGVGAHAFPVREPRPWMQPAQRWLRLLVSHRDQVHVPPTGARSLAGDAFCPHAITAVGDRVLTFQGHPEFAPGYVRAVMARRRAQLGEVTYAAGIASLDAGHDGAVAARWIARFIAGAHAGRGRP